MIKAEEVIRKLKNRQMAEMNKDYNADQEKYTRQLEGDLQAQIQEMKRVVTQLKNVAQIQDDFNITSHRKYIGRFIVFGKKVVRKFLRWYIHPIAEKQTIYNHANIDSMYYMTECIEQIENHIMDITKQIGVYSKELQNNILAEQQGFYIQLENELAASEKELNEELKRDLHKELYKELREELKKELYEELNGVFYKSVEDKVYKQVTEEKIHEANDEVIKARGYANLIKRFNKPEDMQKLEELYRQMIYPHNNKTKIAILCKDYKKDGIIEAIKKEAYTLFNKLKEDDNYEVYFISIEEENVQSEWHSHVIYTNRTGVRDLLNQLNINIVHVFESNAHIIFDNELGLLDQNIVFNGTGQQQLIGLDEHALSELRHLADNNRLHMLVESNIAKEQLEEVGIRNVQRITPIIQVPKKRDNIKSEDFIVGFASSPMQEDQMADRGIGLLEELITNNPEVVFKIAWRNQALEVPKVMLNSTNVIIEYGVLDMDRFYSSINAVIIPYTSKNNNHACSLSAMEAISINIPVICTDIAGVSEIVREIDPNCVNVAEYKAINETLHYVKTNYDKVVKHYKDYNELKGEENNTQIYTQLYESILDEKVQTLAQWDNRLRENDKYLVKGNSNIKKYYENQSIVANYEETRFVEYPMSVVNELEKIAVDEIITKEVKKITSELQILDIATGTGRILEKLIDKGQCTVIDNSSEMLKVIINKYGSTDKLRLIKGDFLDTKINDKFDIITTFRYIRHFDNVERGEIFRRICSILNPNGLLIFDVPNLKTEIALRNSIGWEHFNIYDVFWTPQTLEDELQEYGFEIIKMVPVDGYYFEQLPDQYREEPMSWTVAARYKGDE